ncbi:MAG TPA: glycosyltransferase [Acetivibrio sp.]|nr:glycosyltransferase [Acetivibrio sp.]HPT92057.1 glycosyltransferase [Acetivibrio sp.]
MSDIHVSVVVPAHNEEKYVKRCVDSIRESADEFEGNVEIIIVCNRCTDRTEDIAKENGAIVVKNEDRCIAKVRNAGISAARGKIIITIDCDNRMTKGTISEVYHLLGSGKFIGGGAPIRFERYSFPLWCNDILCRFLFAVTGLYCGMFWATKDTFDAIGGFVEKRAMEDVATAKILKKYGKSKGKKYTSLKKNYLINSTRKYDDLGDWLYFKLMVKNIGTLIKAAMGNTEEYDRLIDEMFYDYNDKH